MITLITATPGGGKTAFVVDELRRYIEEGRPLFIDGIPELKLPHAPVPPQSEWTQLIPDESTETGKKLVFTFPENSLVVIDEAQRIFRNRTAGSRVPDAVAAFETHRHGGIDFLLITQHPSMLDQNVRRLVGRHIHFRDLGILGRYMYEWPECTNPENWKTAPVKKRYSLPKKVFSLYKSSSLHIKPKRSVPPALIALGALALMLVLGGGYLWNSMKEKMAPPVATLTKRTPSQIIPEATQSQSSAPVGAALIEAMIPAHPMHPGSAPLYDGMRQVKVVPRVVGCVAMGKRCDCYTQQETKVQMPFEMCRQWLQNPPFDPFRDEPIYSASLNPEPATGPVMAPQVKDVKPMPSLQTKQPSS